MDADGLKALILSQQQQLHRKDEQLLPTTRTSNLLSRDHEIEHLKLLIAKLQRMQFGRKSEKVERQIEQLTLKLEELEASRAEREQQAPPCRDCARHGLCSLCQEETSRGVHCPNIFCVSPSCMSLRSRRARSVAAAAQTG